MFGHHDKEWAQYARDQIARGNYIRRGNMKLVKDSHGAYYKANGKSCCGCGFDQQMPMGIGNKDRADKPPVTPRNAPAPRRGRLSRNFFDE